MTMRFDYLFGESTIDAQSCSLKLSPSHSRETLTGSHWQHSSLCHDSSEVAWERHMICVPGDLARAEICSDIQYADVTQLAQGKGLANV